MKNKEYWIEVLDSQVKSSVMSCSLMGKNQLIYDNLSKSYLVNLNSTTLIVPKAGSLKITKPVLTFLLYIFSDQPFLFEFIMQDTEYKKKRIVFDNTKTITTQNNYAKLPNRGFVKENWLFLSIDLASIFSDLFESYFLQLDSISIHGFMYIRKIVAADVSFADLGDRLCDMANVNIKFQEINKQFFSKSFSNSPGKPSEKSSPVRRIGKIEKLPTYFSNIRSEEFSDSNLKTPQLAKLKKNKELTGKLSQIIRKSKLHSEIREKSYRNQATPTDLLLSKGPPINFFQRISTNLLNIRHETPPFVASRGNIFYNPVQKEYNNL